MTGTWNHSLIWVMIRIVCPQPASVAHHILCYATVSMTNRPAWMPKSVT